MMLSSKIEFIYSTRDNLEIRFSIPGDLTYYQVCEYFTSFLKGVGYAFDGEVQVVYDETEEGSI